VASTALIKGGQTLWRGGEKNNLAVYNRQVRLSNGGEKEYAIHGGFVLDTKR